MTGFDRSTLAGTAITRARGWNVSAACNARTEILAGAWPVTKVSLPNISPQPQSAEANMDATEGAVLAERATFLLANIGKQAGKLVERALAEEVLHRGAGPTREGSRRRSAAAGLFAQVRRPAAGGFEEEIAVVGRLKHRHCNQANPLRCHNSLNADPPSLVPAYSRLGVDVPSISSAFAEIAFTRKYRSRCRFGRR
jgi:hypothetical protein